VKASTDHPSAPAAREAAVSPFSLLGQRDFRSLWLVGAVNANSRWMESLAVGIWAFEVTRSPFIVSMMLFCRMLPLVLLSAAVGAIAERFDPRRIMSIGLIFTTVLGLLLAFQAWNGTLTVWQAILGAFLQGIYNSTDFPIRRNLLGTTAGTNGVGTAMALESLTLNVTRLVGPTIGGLFMQFDALYGAYLTTAGLSAIGALLIWRMQQRHRSDGAARAAAEAAATAAQRQTMLQSLNEGLAYARARPAILGMLAVTVLANMFAFPFSALIPVIGKENLGLGPFLVGVLAASYGVGAFATSLWYTLRPPRRIGHTYYFGALATMVPLIVFPFSPWFALAAAFLLLSGIGQASFSSTQGAAVFALSDTAMRGRVMGLLATCIGTSPAGVLFMGAVAAGLGATWAVSISAIVGVAGMVAVHLLWPEVKRAQ